MDSQAWFKDKVAEYQDDPVYVLEGLLFDINEKMLKVMEKKGISKKEFAERLEVSPAYVTKLLNGKPNLTLKSLVKIALALEVELDVSLI